MQLNIAKPALNSCGNKILSLICLSSLYSFSAIPQILPKKTIAPTPLSQIQILKLNRNIPAILKTGAPAYKFKNKREMHAYIEGLSSSYGVSNQLLKRILAVESNNCRYRHNAVSNDSGCFQLNATTIKLYKWHKSVVTNDMLNAHAAATLLRDLKTKFAADEPTTWFCRYNTGWRTLNKACQNYLQKLEFAAL